MRPTTKAFVVGTMLGLGTLAACGGPSTTIEQSWTAPGPQVGRLQNVVTLYVSRDGTMRRSVEDAMAQKLAGAGIRAVPAYQVLTDEDLRDRERAKARLAAAGFDGVIANRLVSKETELEYVPGSFDSYWGPAWSMAYDPGYVYTETVVRVETTAFSLTTNQLVWSAISKTVDPENQREVIEQVTSVAARELQKRGIVASAGTRPAGA